MILSTYAETAEEEEAPGRLVTITVAYSLPQAAVMRATLIVIL